MTIVTTGMPVLAKTSVPNAGQQKLVRTATAHSLWLHLLVCGTFGNALELVAFSNERSYQKLNLGDHARVLEWVSYSGGRCPNGVRRGDCALARDSEKGSFTDAEFAGALEMAQVELRPEDRLHGKQWRPMAGAATILLNSPDLESVPASRIVDVEKLFDGLLPLLKYTRTLQSAGTSSKSKASGGRPSLVSLMSTAKRALKAAVRKAEGAAKLPSAVSLLLSSASSHDAALQYAAKSQVLLVQSECDVASLDVEQALAPMVLTKLLSNVLHAVAAAPLPM